MAHWLSTNKDVYTFLFPLVAMTLTLTTILVSRGQRRRDAFSRVHDLLTSPEQQHGRLLLFEAARSGVFPAEGTEEFASMNRAIATLNSVGLYLRRNIVPRSWVLDAWHHPFRDIRPAVEAFLAYRRSLQITASWHVAMDLYDLMNRADRYRTKSPCCDAATPVTAIAHVLAAEPDRGGD
jgi:hypothetical protein